MSQATWLGAGKRVNYPKVSRFGAWFVAEYRLLNMSKWKGSIIAFGLGNPILFLTSIGLGVGSLVDANSPAGVDGVSYLMFLAPALLASATIQGTMDEVMFPTMHGFVWGKVFYGMNNTALTGRQIANGVMIAAMLRTVITAVMYFGVLTVFGAVDSARAWFAMPAAVFAGWGFGSLMLAMSAFVENDDGFFALVGRFVLAPMFLFSGTFYPLSILPTFLQVIGWMSPLWHASEVGRYLAYGHAVSTPLLLVHLGYLLVLGLVGTYIAGWQFNRRLAK